MISEKKNTAVFRSYRIFCLCDKLHIQHLNKMIQLRDIHNLTKLGYFKDQSFQKIKKEKKVNSERASYRQNLLDNGLNLAFEILPITEINNATYLSVCFFILTKDLKEEACD